MPRCARSSADDGVPPDNQTDTEDHCVLYFVDGSENISRSGNNALNSPFAAPDDSAISSAKRNAKRNNTKARHCELLPADTSLQKIQTFLAILLQKRQTLTYDTYIFAHPSFYPNSSANAIKRDLLH